MSTDIELTEETRRRSPPEDVARITGEFAHDAIQLAELQIALARTELSKATKRLVFTAAMFASAAAVCVASIPVGLTAIAFGLESIGLSLPLGFAVATLIGLLIAGTLGLVGYSAIRRSPPVFPRTIREFQQNRIWLTRVLTKAGSNEKI